MSTGAQLHSPQRAALQPESSNRFTHGINPDDALKQGHVRLAGAESVVSVILPTDEAAGKWFRR
jgi:hypothetical protein